MKKKDKAHFLLTRDTKVSLDLHLGRKVSGTLEFSLRKWKERHSCESQKGDSNDTKSDCLSKFGREPKT